MEGVGEAGKEVEGDEVSEQEGDEQRKGGVRAEAGAAVTGAEGEVEGKNEQENPDEAEFKQSG